MGLAKSVARQPGPPIELNTLADVFLQRNMVREATAFLLDVLQGDDPAHDKLQTKARARAQVSSGVEFRVWGVRLRYLVHCSVLRCGGGLVGCLLKQAGNISEVR